MRLLEKMGFLKIVHFIFYRKKEKTTDKIPKPYESEDHPPDSMYPLF